MFISNSYSSKFFDRILNRFLQSLELSSQEAEPEVSTVEDSRVVFLRMVYVSAPSHEFGKRLGALIHDRFGVEVKVVY